MMNERAQRTVMIEGDYATITFVRRLPHPIVAVWAAITDPEHRAVWFGPLSIDPRQGGMIEMVVAPPAHA
jgi:uncharacterized protein YndB with AHSA1/START domain